MKLLEVVNQYCYENILAKDTKSTYFKRVKAFDERVNYESIATLSKDDVLHWRDLLLEEGKRHTTVNNYIRHCKAIWQFAMDQEIIVADDNIFSVRKLPEIAKKKVISEKTVNTALLNLTSQNDWFWHAVILLQADLGIRNRQLIMIQKCDVCLETDVIYCSAEGNKKRKDNTLPLSNLSVGVIKDFLKRSTDHLGYTLRPDDYLFEIGRYDSKYKKYDHGRMTRSQLQGMYTRLSNKIFTQTGERISGHRLRHTLATKIGSRPDVNIRVIQEWFGWTCIQTAQNYIQVSLEQKRALINEK